MNVTCEMMKLVRVFGIKRIDENVLLGDLIEETYVVLELSKRIPSQTKLQSTHEPLPTNTRSPK